MLAWWAKWAAELAMWAHSQAEEVGRWVQLALLHPLLGILVELPRLSRSVPLVSLRENTQVEWVELVEEMRESKS